MLTKTAIRNPHFLARVRAAAAAAVRHAHSPERRALQIGHAVVHAKKTGRVALLVSFRRGAGLAFCDLAGRDMTAAILGALRAWHAGQRTSLPPVGKVRELSAARAFAELVHAGQGAAAAHLASWHAARLAA